MKYMNSVLGGLFASVLLTTSAFAADSDLWTLSLGGSGAVGTQSPSTFNGGTSLSLGHTGNFILPLEVGVRQDVGYSTGNNWALNTKVYSDWTLVKLGNLEFDAGVNAGVSYGDVPLTWTVAPEAVSRLWLLKNVNAYVRVELPFVVKSDSFHTQNKVGLDFGLQIRF